jgi:thiol-disulfide isomerase/thioredoxin
MPSSLITPKPLQRRIQRRDMLVAGAALGLPAWAIAQAAKKPAKPTLKRGKPMTAAEESVAAKAVAESIAQQTGEPAHPAVGTTLRLPATFKLFDGQDFSEAQAKGKLLMVFYWASWCPICKVVEPRLHDFWMKNRAKGIEVLALSTDTEVQPAFAHIQKTGWKYPASMAAAAKLDDNMTPRSLPTLFVRSKLGVIVNADEGEIDAEDFKDYLVHL